MAAVCLLLAPVGPPDARPGVRAAALRGAPVAARLRQPRARRGGCSGCCPILALWANLHGTVVLGAVLVALRGPHEPERAPRTRPHRRCRRARARRSLLLAAPLLVLASPYGSELVSYYHQMLDSPLFRDYVVEWQTSKPSGYTSIFYVIAFAAVALVARQARHVTRFELLALALLTVSALTAIRSIVWFGLAATIILPALLDSEFPQRPPRRADRLPLDREGRRERGDRRRDARSWSAGRPRGSCRTGRMAPSPPSAASSPARARASGPTTATPTGCSGSCPQARGRVALDIRYELLSKPPVRGSRGLPRPLGRAVAHGRARLRHDRARSPRPRAAGPAALRHALYDDGNVRRAAQSRTALTRRGAAARRMGDRGFEPRTSSLSERRSNQLS